MRFFLVSYFITVLYAINHLEDFYQDEDYEVVHFQLKHFASDNQLEFDFSGEHYKLQLIANNHLTNEKHSETCHYLGHILEPIKYVNNSNLALSLCPNRGIRGSITTTDTKMFITPSNKSGIYQPTDEHVMYKQSITKRSSRHLLGRYDRNKVELYVMADPGYCNLFKTYYGSNWKSNLQSSIKDLINDASAEYEWWNWGDAGSIELGMITLEIVESFTGIYTSLYPEFISWSSCKDWTNWVCAIDGVKYIRQFRSFFKENNRYGDAHLMISGINFGGAQGWGGVGTICKATTAAIVESKTYTRRVATIAHELGHNFGMQHDSDKGVMGSDNPQTDSNGKYIWATDPITGKNDLDMSSQGWSTTSYNYLNAYFKKADGLSCLKDGIRSFNTIHNTPTNDASNDGWWSAYTYSSHCIDIEQLSSQYNGEWHKSDEDVNDRSAYKRASYWLYTAIDDDGNRVWTINSDKDDGVNQDYYCSEAEITDCSGKWLIYGHADTNSVFDECGSFTSNLECLNDNEYKENVCIVDDNEEKEFGIVTNMCYNDAVIYYNEYYNEYLYFNEQYEYVDDDDLTPKWIISLNDINNDIVAECHEFNLFECDYGNWQILQTGNDSLSMIIDPKMSIKNGKCSLTKKANVSAVIGVVITLVVLVLILIICGFLIYQRQRSKQLKKIDANMVGDESEEELAIEENEIEVQVETETILTQS